MGIVIAGTIPPPIGGVSIHTKRLMYYLNKEGISYTFLELRPFKDGHFDILTYIKNVFYLVLGSREDVVHYQMNNLLEAALISLVCRIMRKKFIYTFHSFRPKNFNCLMKLSYKLCCKLISFSIAPSKTIKKELIKKGMNSNKIYVISTYLPATREEYEAYIPDDIRDFCLDQKKILVANAYKLYKDKDGVDVYGLDMCIEACRRLEDIKILFCIPSVGDEAYYQNCCELIDTYKLRDRILIYRKNISLVSIFRFCDIFIRPTNTDSYGISIEEALVSGIQAIASDVCERTEGTLLFKNRNLEDMISKIEMCLHGNKIQYVASNYKDILRLYETLVK